jgi:hypothetical protein
MAKRKGVLLASGAHREVGPERSVEQSRGFDPLICQLVGPPFSYEIEH